METYKVVNGISFKNETPNDLCVIISNLIGNNKRYRFDFGNTETKVSWNEIYDIDGYIGKSTGMKKVPLLIHNKRSLGGGEISTHRVLSITEIKTKKIIYSV